MNIYTPTSGTFIKNLLGGKVKILKYNELYKYNSFDKLLDPYGVVMILYETKKNNGHWVTIFRRNKKLIEIFDSYGFHMPNDELELISDDFRISDDMKYDYLADLILNNKKYNIEWNDYNFQSTNSKVATCGYWCICRYLLRELSLNQFKKLFDNNKNKDQYMIKLLKYLL